MFPAMKYAIVECTHIAFLSTANKKNMLFYSSTPVDQVKWWHILLTVIAAILCVPGMSLWIAVGVVLSKLDGIFYGTTI